MISSDKKIINCIGQCRASTDKQAQTGDTLEDQERAIREFVATKGWKLVPDGKVWSTPISGRKSDRFDFEDVLDYIKKHPGYVDYYVFKCIDRFTRRGTGGYEEMRKRLLDHRVNMIDVAGIIQPSKNTLEHLGESYDWSESRPSEITENVLATTAKQEVTTILTRMIGKEIELTRLGYRMRRPPDGFVNGKIYVDGKKRAIQTPDTIRAKFFIAMFESRARGTPDPETVEKINALGYKSKLQNKWNKEHNKIVGHTGGVKLTVKQLQRVIQNPAYAGIVCEKWTKYKPIKAPYENAEIVSIDLFNRANRGYISIVEHKDGSVEIVKGYPHGKTGKVRLKNNPLFPYKFLLCPFCRKPFLGSKTKGKSGNKFPAYHCARVHKRFGVKKDDFDSNVERYINSLVFDPGIANGLRLTFINKYREREKEIAKAASHIHQNLADIESKIAAKIEAIVASKSLVVRGKLEREVETLDAEATAVKVERGKIEITEDDIKAFGAEAKKIMEHPAEILLDSSSIEVQRGLFELVFEKMPTYHEIVNGTPKLSWVFKLSSDFTVNKNQLVTLPGVEPGLQP